MLEKTLESPLNCKEIQLVHPKGNIHWKDWCWGLNSNTLATWCKELTHLKRRWCWERLKVGGEGDDRGWNGWMASPTQWTWVWVNSRSWWWTARPGVLQSMGSQRVRHDWVTELNWTDWNLKYLLKIIFTKKFFIGLSRVTSPHRYEPWCHISHKAGIAISDFKSTETFSSLYFWGWERERERDLGKRFPSPSTKSSIDLQSWVHLRSVFSRWKHPEQLGQPILTHLWFMFWSVTLWEVYDHTADSNKLQHCQPPAWWW